MFQPSLCAGMAGASLLALGGLYVIPAQKKRLRSEISRKILLMREELVELSRREFERELESAVATMEESLMPFSRFVRVRVPFVIL